MHGHPLPADKQVRVFVRVEHDPHGVGHGPGSLHALQTPLGGQHVVISQLYAGGGGGGIGTGLFNGEQTYVPSLAIRS